MVGCEQCVERRIAPPHHFTGAEFGVGAGAPCTKHCRSAPSPGAFRGVPAGASQELVWPISGRPNNAWGDKTRTQGSPADLHARPRARISLRSGLPCLRIDTRAAPPHSM